MAMEQSSAVYDKIGVTYRSTRRPDARIAALIESALPNGASVLNVGAGTGSYEPDGAKVFAVEPSQTMIAQRGPHSGPAIRAVAEELPLATASVDVVLGVLTMHHWRDVRRGLRECVRVARSRLIFLTWDPQAPGFWLVDDYFPRILDHARTSFPTIGLLRELLGRIDVVAVPIPADCTDGFLGAYWKRPTAYLDPLVRQGISGFSLVDGLSEGLVRLRDDLESGMWDRRQHGLRELDALDLGYRLVVADV